MTAAVPPRSAGPSTPAEVADVFEVLTTAAHWFENEQQDTLFPVAPSPVERALADVIVVEARGQLARLDPPVLLAGVAVWVARHPEAADAGTASVFSRLDQLWSTGAGV